MARHLMTNVTVMNGSDEIDGVRSLEIEETVPDVDLTAAGDAAQTHGTGIPGWTATLTVLADYDVAANQGIRAGDVLDFEGYTEGNSTGKTYWAGQATVLSTKVGGSYDAEETREWSLKGQGALSSATVSA
jgi:hypothetical protein